jgi:hypothetical protein
MPLDGVTGHIELSRNTFLRTAIPAVFVQGKAQLPDAVPTTAVQLFPDQFVNKTPSPSKP